MHSANKKHTYEVILHQQSICELQIKKNQVQQGDSFIHTMGPATTKQNNNTTKKSHKKLESEALEIVRCDV